jgi:hypothetical protein
MKGPTNNNALKALKIYTGIDKTVVSQTGSEGIDSSITNFESIEGQGYEHSFRYRRKDKPYRS